MRRNTDVGRFVAKDERLQVKQAMVKRSSKTCVYLALFNRREGGRYHDSAPIVRISTESSLRNHVHAL